MKKIISVLLSLILLLGVVMNMSSCGLAALTVGSFAIPNLFTDGEFTGLDQIFHVILDAEDETTPPSLPDGGLVWSDGFMSTVGGEVDAVDELDPVFVETSMQGIVFTRSATVRTSTMTDKGNDKDKNNLVTTLPEQTVLEITGESEHWYRILYAVNGVDTECYVSKYAICDASFLSEFVAVEGGEEEVEIIAKVANLYSIPSSDSDKALRGALNAGEKIVRVAQSAEWSRVEYTTFYYVIDMTDKTTTPKTETKEYYIRNADIRPAE